MMIRRASLCAVALLTLTASVSWCDSQFLPRRIWCADLIVVGHVVGEIHELPESQLAMDRCLRVGFPLQLKALLAVDEVLKGEPPGDEVPFLFPSEMSLLRYSRDTQVLQYYPTRYDSKYWMLRFCGNEPLGDAREPAVWVLARCEVGRTGSRAERIEEFAVHGHATVQPLATKPFFETAIRDPRSGDLVAFLDDPEPSVRMLALQYLSEARQKSAFPKVAELLGDHEIPCPSLAIEACRRLAGKAAIPYLRPLLDAEREVTIRCAATTLAELGDTNSVPRMNRLLLEANQASTRSWIAQALAELDDHRAIPALIAALKDDGFGGLPYWPATWMQAREALREITGCYLSPNGDKAEGWWDVAQDLDEQAWEHFGLADLIRGLPVMGPSDHHGGKNRLAEAAALQTEEETWNLLYFCGRGHYDPVAAQVQWLAWLDEQGWNDWRALPSQVDDELQITVEPTTALDSGEPVHLRYTIRNVSNHDIWLCKHYWEVSAVRFPDGTGHYFGQAPQYGWDPQEVEVDADDFFRVPAGQQRFVVGDGCFFYNCPELDRYARPRAMINGLCFFCHGTAFGLDAWVGEVWAGEIKFPVEPGYGQN